MYLPRASVAIAGFVLAGLLGVGAYFLPAFQVAATGLFKQITPAEGWAQPAASPGGSHLVAIKRSLNASDIYLLGTNGQVESRLTKNVSKRVEANHWAFYPRFSPDGSAVFYSYDAKDPYNSYRVDLAIHSRPANPAATRSTDWTQPTA